MSNIHYFVLAFVQGITEFIPVSSSGHLVLLQRILKIDQPMLGFDILLHLATALAVVMFTRREWAGMCRDAVSAIADLRRKIPIARGSGKYPQLRMLGYIGLAFMPAAVLGVLVYDTIERLFASLAAAGCGFLVTGVILLATRRQQANNTARPLRPGDALTIGLAQAVAMLPGVSRSGLTIAAGLFRGVERTTAARFSFLLSVPTIAAAGVFQLKNGWQMPDCGVGVLLGACAVAGVSGYAALAVVSRLVARARFHYFGYYCICLGIITLLLAAR